MTTRTIKDCKDCKDGTAQTETLQNQDLSPSPLGEGLG
jgi:hypothetical protein